jgi:hypothetical protein
VSSRRTIPGAPDTFRQILFHVLCGKNSTHSNILSNPISLRVAKTKTLRKPNKTAYFALKTNLVRFPAYINKMCTSSETGNHPHSHASTLNPTIH